MSMLEMQRMNMLKHHPEQRSEPLGPQKEIVKDSNHPVLFGCK
jgi:hypothetical protein